MNAACKTRCKTQHFADAGNMVQTLAGKDGAGEGNRTLVFSLEGCKIPVIEQAFSCKTGLKPAISFQWLSEEM